jgi:hypothetical protein
MSNHEYDSFSDDDDFENYNIIYDSGENSKTRFNIVICELYNNNIHGVSPNNSNVIYHYLTIHRYKTLDMDIINDMCEFLNAEYIYIPNQHHNIFRNYRNIINKENYIKPEIAECIYLQNGESVCIIKTFWIKIIQRTWKRIFKERNNIIKERKSIHALFYREINGKWPSYCYYYPSIKGMLSV